MKANSVLGYIGMNPEITVPFSTFILRKKLKKTVHPFDHPLSYKKILVDTGRVINVAYTGPNVYPCVKKSGRQLLLLIIRLAGF